MRYAERTILGCEGVCRYRVYEHIGKDGASFHAFIDSMQMNITNTLFKFLTLRVSGIQINWRTYDTVIAAATPFIPMYFSSGLANALENHDVNNAVSVARIEKKKTTTHLLLITSKDLPESRTDDRRLDANTSGESSRKMWLLARKRRMRT